MLSLLFSGRREIRRSDSRAPQVLWRELGRLWSPNRDSPRPLILGDHVYGRHLAVIAAERYVERGYESDWETDAPPFRGRLAGSVYGFLTCRISE
jgi:hypothetical protein